VKIFFNGLGAGTQCGNQIPFLKVIARAKLLIINYWGLASLTPDQGREMLEIVDDRHGRGSTIITSQLAVEHWHDAIANPTVADAILDRLVHNAHRFNLKGESIRRTTAKRSGLDDKTAA
jgi:DNA replication protein DnaC